MILTFRSFASLKNALPYLADIIPDDIASDPHYVYKYDTVTHLFETGYASDPWVLDI